jgi:hypothetical protein
MTVSYASNDNRFGSNNRLGPSQLRSFHLLLIHSLNLLQMRDPRTQHSDLMRVRVLVLRMHDTAEQATEQLIGGRQVYR